jgi:hypothetical protein
VRERKPGAPALELPLSDRTCCCRLMEAANKLTGCLHSQGFIRMAFVVVLEPPRKLRQDRLCIRAIVNVSIISLERFDEGLGHPV